MTTIGDRLEYYIHYKGYKTMRAFCNEHEFVYGTMVQLGGKRRLGLDILDKIATLWPELNMNWLLYNRGTMEVQYDFPEWITQAALAMAKELKSDAALREKALEFFKENRGEAL